jgi:serine/threonine-protein kinase RsbW
VIGPMMAHWAERAQRSLACGVMSPGFVGVAERREFAGRPESIRVARRWVQCVLREADVSAEVVDAAVVCASELATNAILHTASGDPDGTYLVLVRVTASLAWVLVVDQGSEKVPVVKPNSVVAEAQRGLALVKGFGTLVRAGGSAGRWVGVALDLADGLTERATA